MHVPKDRTNKTKQLLDIEMKQLLILKMKSYVNFKLEISILKANFCNGFITNHKFSCHQYNCQLWMQKKIIPVLLSILNNFPERNRIFPYKIFCMRFCTDYAFVLSTFS